MSGGTGSGLFPQCRTFFLTYPMYACISFAFPWEGKVPVGRMRSGQISESPHIMRVIASQCSHWRGNPPNLQTFSILNQ